MERPDSDIDLNIVYMADADNILAGDPVKRADEMVIESESGSPKFDIHMYEIGHLVHLLKKGNVNAIWAVCSPIKPIPDSGCGYGVCNATSIAIGDVINVMDVKFDGNMGVLGRSAHVCLDEIVRSNLSRESYHSIHGMAQAQILDAEKHPEQAIKMLKSCIRTCNFGIKLLTDGELVFDPVKEPKQMGSEFHRLSPSRSIQLLDEAYKNSPLPDRPDEKRFRSFLLNVRTDSSALLKDRKLR